MPQSSLDTQDYTINRRLQEDYNQSESTESTEEEINLFSQVSCRYNGENLWLPVDCLHSWRGILDTPPQERATIGEADLVPEIVSPLAGERLGE
jgi:hypothetical protein